MTTVLLRSATLGLAVAGLGIWSPGGAPAVAEELTVYTAIEADDLTKYAERFNQEHPDIKIKWVRDSTGVITAKLLAEKDNPQADVVWGVAATSLLLLKDEGMLEPYAPTGVENARPQVRRQRQPADLGRHGRLRRRRSASTPSRPRASGLPHADHLGGPDQARIQGPCRDAEPEHLGHRLPRRLELAADVRRGGGLEVHGRAAPEHRGLHPFRLQALQAWRPPARR